MQLILTFQVIHFLAFSVDFWIWQQVYLRLMKCLQLIILTKSFNMFSRFEVKAIWRWVKPRSQRIIIGHNQLYLTQTLIVKSYSKIQLSRMNNLIPLLYLLKFKAHRWYSRIVFLRMSINKEEAISKIHISLKLDLNLAWVFMGNHYLILQILF